MADDHDPSFFHASTMYALLLAALAAPALQHSPDLALPFRVLAGEVPIDVDYGHAMPAFVDWNEDALPDLLVGQYSGGRLRIYENVGVPGAPRFETFRWFETSAGRASVPIS